MYSHVSNVITEKTAFKFDCAEKSFLLEAPEIPGLILGLQVSAEKTTLLFREVVVIRTVPILNSHSRAISINNDFFIDKGPFTSEQMLAMCRHQAGISGIEWREHMNKAGRISVLSSSSV